MVFKRLTFGIIGISEGNGHPYSWSAIFNGYDPLIMSKCEFPIIPNYLSKRNFPSDAILEGRVTHIWTQNKFLSKKIASACFIENIVENFSDMIGKVDAVLLARDDADNHLEIAKPFILSGLPIYIDKPLSFSLKEAKMILDMQRYPGQIFTCSALAYAKEFLINKEQLKQIGAIKSIQGFAPNSWSKYSVHVIEPILNIIPERGRLLQHNKEKGKNTLHLKYENINRVSISTLGAEISTPRIIINGELGLFDLILKDTFSAFKDALLEFTYSILQKTNPILNSKTLEIIKIIELGNNE